MLRYNYSLEWCCRRPYLCQKRHQVDSVSSVRPSENEREQAIMNSTHRIEVLMCTSTGLVVQQMQFRLHVGTMSQVYCTARPDRGALHTFISIKHTNMLQIVPTESRK